MIEIVNHETTIAVGAACWAAGLATYWGALVVRGWFDRRHWERVGREEEYLKAMRTQVRIEVERALGVEEDDDEDESALE